jgi:hypothetical protein
MRIYAFDVDHTLELSEGPVSLGVVVDLRRGGGAIVGLCGNWAVVTRAVPGWHEIFSFVGPIDISKAAMLLQLRSCCPADDYVLVGNDPRVYGNSDDVTAAADAGWRFIREYDFAAGMR